MLNRVGHGYGLESRAQSAKPVSVFVPWRNSVMAKSEFISA
jgi:hypothetical protein